MPDLYTTLAATEADRLEQAEARVRAFCGWHIAPRRLNAEYVVRDPGPIVVLPSLKVTAVTIADADGIAIDEDDYTWTETGIITRLNCAWWARGTAITFAHGHDFAPAEVTAVVQAVAQRAISNPGSLTSQSAGPFSATFSTGATLGLLDSEKEALRPYRLTSLA